MKLRTKGGQPLRKGNADPRFNKAFKLHFYRTFSGRIEIRLIHLEQDQQTGKWSNGRKIEILHGAGESKLRISELLDEWIKS